MITVCRLSLTLDFDPFTCILSTLYAFTGTPSPSDSAVVEWRTAFIATAAAAVALGIVALVCYHRLNEARAASAGQLQRGHAEAGHPFNLLPTVECNSGCFSFGHEV